MTTAAPVPVAGPRRLRALLGLAALVATVLGALLATAGPASAHAALTGSDPRQGAVVDSAPRQVTLTFSEDVAIAEGDIRVLDPQGRRVDTGAVRDLGEGAVVRYAAPLHAGLPDGTFTVAWKAVSGDSHPIAGAFTFSIGAPSKTAAEVPSAEREAGSGPVGVLYDVARYLSYGGFVLFVGGSVFVLVCLPRAVSVRAVQRVVLGGWAALAGGTIAQLLLRGPYTGSGRLADVLDPGVLPAVLATRPGTALASRLLLLAVAGLFAAVLFGAYARRVAAAEAGTAASEGGASEGGASGGGDGAGPAPDGARRDLAFGLGAGGSVVAVGLATTWVVAEHAAAGPQTAVAMPVHTVHLLAAAVWLGGLAALLAVLYRGPAVRASVVRRFSRLAFAAVAVLAATGTYQSWRQLGSWEGLVATAYGRLLLVKLGLVVVLLGIARISRRWTSLLGEPDTQAEAGEPRVPASVPAGGTTAESGSADPRRAAQLARQRAAVAKAREQRRRDADPGRAGLRRSVLAEAAVAATVLTVTTLLTGTEPARTAEAARAAAGPQAAQPVSVRVPFDTGGPQGKGTAIVDIEPGGAGVNTVHLRTTGPGGRPLDAEEVRLSFTLRSKDLGPLRVQPDRIEAGHWTAADVDLPMPGTWRMDLTVRTSDIDQVTTTRNVKIG